MNLISPVDLDFIWVAEYSEGTYLAEYDFQTKEPNKFYSIKRDQLIRFGMVGHGMKLFYEVFGGTFKLQGQMIDFVYKDGDEEYPLTGQPLMYNDIITFKDAESTAIPGGRFDNRVVQYNFGYKARLVVKGITFNLKVLCVIPFNQPAYLQIRLVADQSLDGVFIIKQNGLERERYQAHLDENVGGELNWVIK